MTSPQQWDKFFKHLGDCVMAELRHPSGDFPIEPGVRREVATALGLDHETTEHEMSELGYFEKVGLTLCQALAKGTLAEHISGPMARDQGLARRQMPRGPSYDQDDPDMPVRGGPMQNDPDDDDNNAGEPGTGTGNPTGEECLAFCKKALQLLPEPDRSQFLEGLTDLVSTQPSDALDGTLTLRHNGNGLGGGSRPAYGDTGWSNGIRDNNKSAVDRNRRPALDAKIQSVKTSQFAKRFPEAMNIRFSGNGR
jgi:hypothetical protein